MIHKEVMLEGTKKMHNDTHTIKKEIKTKIKVRMKKYTYINSRRKKYSNSSK